ncbi:MAG TPA: SDR family NAD(P)-dependent oxidoreductase [Acidimicrobiales bacterium]|nr:SDR family NAD(P)-dependent oxidoreductase [Acidimicrobiales bacterium]
MILRARDLRGAVVVLTGASSGLGRATAEAFAAHGSRLVLAARTEEALAEVAAACREAGAEAVAVPTDVRDPEAVDRLRRRAVEEFGHVDVWVDAAGVLVAAPFGEEEVDELEALVATNVGGPLFGSRAALATFRQQGHGTLVNVSSLLGLVPNPVVPSYVMSKFAVRGLTLSLRQLVAGERHIHVCDVMPGPIDTPLFARAANRTGRQLRAIPPAYAPERVAAGIVACARRPRREMTVGVASHLILASHRLAPAATEWAVAQAAGRLILRPTPASPTSGAVVEPDRAGPVHGGWRRGGRLRRAAGERLGTLQGRRGADPA